MDIAKGYLWDFAAWDIVFFNTNNIRGSLIAYEILVHRRFVYTFVEYLFELHHVVQQFVNYASTGINVLYDNFVLQRFLGGFWRTQNYFEMNVVKDPIFVACY